SATCTPSELPPFPTRRSSDLTLLGLCAGFAVLGFSELRSQAQFGLLAAATLAFGCVADLTVTPALCAGVRVVSLWEVLSLDLGADRKSTRLNSSHVKISYAVF